MESIVDQAELIHWVDKTRNAWLIVEQLPIKSEATRTTIRPEFNIPTDILVLNARDHSTKRYSFLSFNLSTYMTIWPKIRVAIYLFFFMCTRPFDQNIRSSLIYSFFWARPLDQKLRSTLIYLFLCTRPFDKKLGSSLINFIFTRPFDQKLGSSLIYFFIYTQPFDLIIGSSFIYSFFSARPFDLKLGSSLIYFFHLHTTIRQKDMIFLHSFILSLFTTIRLKR